AAILERLHTLPEAPCNDLKGKPLNDRGLAVRLRQYSVKSGTLNLGGESRAKGYTRASLHDVWQYYLPPPPPSSDRSVTSVTSVTNPHLQGEKVTDVTGVQRSVTDDKGEENADEMSVGTDVTDVTLTAGNRGGNGSLPLCEHCGTPGRLNPYDWPQRPGGIILHSSCEGPWFDSEARR